MSSFSNYGLAIVILFVLAWIINKLFFVVLLPFGTLVLVVVIALSAAAILLKYG